MAQIELNLFTIIGENVKHSCFEMAEIALTLSHSPPGITGIMLATDWTVGHRTSGLLVTGFCQIMIAFYDNHIDRQVVGLEPQTLPGGALYNINGLYNTKMSDLH